MKYANAEPTGDVFQLDAMWRGRHWAMTAPIHGSHPSTGRRKRLCPHKNCPHHFTSRSQYGGPGTMKVTVIPR